MSTSHHLEVTTIDPPAPTPHTHTIIFLHGRGDNTKSFISALRTSTLNSFGFS